MAISGHKLYAPFGAGALVGRGVLAFNLCGVSYAKLAAILSAEYGIGVRHGGFCAHPLMTHLLGIDDAHARDIGANLRSGRPVTVPGAVRLSVGLGTTVEDITQLIDALITIASDLIPTVAE